MWIVMLMFVQVLIKFATLWHFLILSEEAKNISKLKLVTAHYLCFYLGTYLIILIKQDETFPKRVKQERFLFIFFNAKIS